MSRECVVDLGMIPAGVLEYRAFVLALYVQNPRLVSQRYQQAGFAGVAVVGSSVMMQPELRKAIKQDAGSGVPLFHRDFMVYLGRHG